jgi:predicted Rossmann fold flavoprotein
MTTNLVDARPHTDTDVLILGAGAAGLFWAIHAARRGRRTLVLDHADKPGKKILISGGGRSNFTNLNAAPENFLSANPHFARSALARYTPQDFLALVEAHRIPWHEKHLGQLFCDRSAQDIVNLLLRECAAANARIQLSTQVLSVAQTGSAFRVESSGGVITAQSLVVATGGLSIPKLGATALGYELARQFGLAIVEPRPALVPLVLSPEDQTRWCDLTGLSAEVVASTMSRAEAGPRSGNRKRTAAPAFREKMLVTHRGLSGPAILQISSYWQPREAIQLDLAPGAWITAPLTAREGRRDPAALATALRTQLPARLADRWVQLQPPADGGRNYSNAALAEVERALHAWTLFPAGSEGFAKAEVTAGGVSTAELDSRTMQATRVPGLFFIGEVVDVTGWLGGYNFQWAWSSGFSAGQAA